MPENIITYRDQGAGIAIESLPDEVDEYTPVLIIFNAGLLHRSEPFRLHTQLARSAAAAGFIAIRLDLAGKGDSAVRDGYSNRESVAADWQALLSAITSRHGQRGIILMGLCSGADNAIKIASKCESVRGLILLDPYFPPSPGHRLRHLWLRLRQIRYWPRLPAALCRSIANLYRGIRGQETAAINPLSLRDLPYPEEEQAVFQGLIDSQGRVLALFTSYALFYCNQRGSFTSHIGLDNFQGICEEHLWPFVTHVYIAEFEREMLMDTALNWMKKNRDNFRL